MVGTTFSFHERRLLTHLLAAANPSDKETIIGIKIHTPNRAPSISIRVTHMRHFSRTVLSSFATSTHHQPLTFRHPFTIIVVFSLKDTHIIMQVAMTRGSRHYCNHIIRKLDHNLVIVSGFSMLGTLSMTLTLNPQYNQHSLQPTVGAEPRSPST